MAAATAVPPAAPEPVLDSQGGLTSAWRRFFEALWIRSGKFQEITITATTNTNLTISYKGSDGVVRSGNLTLS